MHILRNTLLFLVLEMVTTSGLAQVKTFNKRLHLGQRTMVLGALHVTDTAYYATGIVVDTVTPGSNYVPIQL